VHNIKIALLGPIVPQSNPVLLAEEMAMLDTMAEGPADRRHAARHHQRDADLRLARRRSRRWPITRGRRYSRRTTGSPPRCWNSTSVAGEGRRPANVNRVLPINFCGGPNEIVAQLKQCRE